MGNEIFYTTELLTSNLCDYNDTYILLRVDSITTAYKISTSVAFKNCAPFTNCITKIGGATTDDAEYVDLAMPMYNLIE